MNHIPVLKSEIVDAFDYLADRKDGVFADGTLGLAGHSLAIAKSLESGVSGREFIGIDRDAEALKLAEKRIKVAGLENNFILCHNNFKNIRSILKELKVDKIDGALLDLGVSSMQLDEKNRGFSFQNPDELLDMRMDQSQTLTAANILNHSSERDIIQILFEYGEENFAKKIGHLIVEKRKQRPFKTVNDILIVISQAIPVKLQKTGRIHPATRTFQALRIAVNEELSGLSQAISDFADVLNPSAKLAVISFHSLEDRIIKNTLRDLADPCECPKSLPCVCDKVPVGRILTKKPVVASEKEIADNPRSRSAKLRIFEKF